MKIGILTFHFVYNYGALLQAYALKYFLSRQEDFDVRIIDYRPAYIDKAYHKRFSNLYYAPRKFINELFISKEKLYRRFDYFINDCLTPDQYSKSGLSEYDAIIVGSDQVWNEKITNRDLTYLLKCIRTTKTKKISYGASIIWNESSDRWKKQLINELTKFTAISVREKNDKEELVKRINNEVSCVVDPTLLLNAEIWSSLEKKPKNFDMEKYVLIYILNPCEYSDTLIKNYKETNKSGFISIHPLSTHIFDCDVDMKDIGPQEFLWLIHHADLVITDSFHANVFASIFCRKTVTWTINSKGSRIKTLYSYMGVDISKHQGEDVASIRNFNSVLSEVEYSKKWITDQLKFK